MDTTALDISFDVLGHCNYCTSYLEREGVQGFDKLTSKVQGFKKLCENIKKAGRQKNMIVSLV
jgi:hypothetical protein